MDHGLTLDAGTLIALERGDQRVDVHVALHAEAHRHAVMT